MADETAAPRSRRALLTAAAGAAGAIAASAVLPLTAAAAAGDPVLQENDNATAATTSITNATVDSIAFGGNGAGTGYGVEGTSAGGAGVSGWSVSAPGEPFLPEYTAYTGVFGSSPTAPIESGTFGAGVWGDSADTGVYGSGDTGVQGFGQSAGVYGYGGVGVVGESGTTSAGVLAIGQSATDLALEVQGKVKFSRSGRVTLASGKSSIKVTLAGTTSGSRVFAVLHSNRTGRWVQSVIPTTGYFTIYLNGTVSSSTYIAWFVLN
jgi:hypothetical protein